MRKEKRVYDFCRLLDADRYINAIGGQQMYKKDAFKEQGRPLFHLLRSGPV